MPILLPENIRLPARIPPQPDLRGSFRRRGNPTCKSRDSDQTPQMPQYIAFLRGINVGGHRVKMDRLKELFEELGFDDVWTFIASGNVIFRTKSGKPEALAKKIETQLSQALGYDVPTVLKTPTELSQITATKPFADCSCADDDLYVVLLGQTAPKESSARLNALATQDDEFMVQDREIFWLRRKPVSESRISTSALTKAIGVTHTMRNMTMMRKLESRTTNNTPDRDLL